MNNHFKNAFPAMPMLDKFQQPVFPQTGLSKVEFFALEIFKIYASEKEAQHIQRETLYRISFNDALDFLTFIETKQNENEKDNKLPIIES